jgi:hypothetical protein
MVTSYEGIAQAKGWPVGKLYKNERMSYLIVLGIMCQWGSVIISFFVNPWWSAFLVLVIGFYGNMFLTIVFKSFTRFVALPLAVGSFFLVTLFAFSSNSPLQESSTAIQKSFSHFHNSIEYANRSTEVSNQLGSFQKVEDEKVQQMVDLKRKALNEAKLVKIEILSNKIPGFKEHFENKYIKGLEYFIEGHTENDNSKIFESHKLLRSWGNWYNRNYEKF